jgi:hypothetical protein
VSELWAAWVNCCAPSPPAGVIIVVTMAAVSVTISAIRNRKIYRKRRRKAGSVQLTPFERK